MPGRGRGRGRGKGGAASAAVEPPPSLKIALDLRPSGKSMDHFFASMSNEFIHCQDALSFFPQLMPAKLRGQSLTLDLPLTPISWTPHAEGSFQGVLRVRQGLEERDVLAYEKRIPLIDPFRWMKYKERPSMPFFWDYQVAEIKNPENQAYIDCVASYLTSKLGQMIKSPHFCQFYGCFRAVAKTFRFNLEDDLEDIRFTRWFWEGVEEGQFKLSVVEQKSGKKLSLTEIQELLKPDDEFLHEDNSDDEDDNNSQDDTESKVSAESLNFGENTSTPNCEYSTLGLEEAILEDAPTEEPIQLVKRRSNSTPQSLSLDSEISSFTDDYIVHAEFEGMPVVVMYSELCQGTMDALLNDNAYAPINSETRETMWAAWMFQVIAALCSVQSGLRLTHNDLHTNNLLWKETKQEFLYYKDSLNRFWKVPTFGKVFMMIDYGRAIFNMNSFYCISSDYNDGHDASGQYNFGPIEDPDLPRVLPNYSFDLCRLSCSLVRGLYPTNPATLEQGSILTNENGWIVRQSICPVFNILWTWLRDDDGTSILETQSGAEKYPGFDLYIIIAHTVHGAIPKEQLKLPVFQSWKLTNSSEAAGTTYIPL
jgi:hypothetical protein